MPIPAAARIKPNAARINMLFPVFGGNGQAGSPGWQLLLLICSFAELRASAASAWPNWTSTRLDEPVAATCAVLLLLVAAVFDVELAQRLIPAAFSAEFSVLSGRIAPILPQSTATLTSRVTMLALPVSGLPLLRPAALLAPRVSVIVMR